MKRIGKSNCRRNGFLIDVIQTDAAIELQELGKVYLKDRKMTKAEFQGRFNVFLVEARKLQEAIEKISLEYTGLQKTNR